MAVSLSLLGILMVLGAGMLSFASPCFLPVVPVFVGYLSGGGELETASDDNPGRTAVGLKARRGAIGQAGIFIAAFSLVFIVLWSLVGLIGWVVGSYRNYLRIGGGILLVIIGLHTARLLVIPLLDRVLQPKYRPDQQAAPNWRRSLALGLAFGAGWTPCIGPILGGVIGLATTSDSLGVGVILMVVYSLGLGIPFILVCAGADWVTSRMKWFLTHQKAVNIVVGLCLVVVGFLMITNLFSRLAALMPI
ncbi:MAG: cytochrome c biogenesis protein CcdA [Propionibacteriaceae bacterium]|jgi:cytochrome c-type biogenesis protein|nr:cytochrome c biogenesis protein CcdA [Propionibacteriaceae bacterium]